MIAPHSLAPGCFAFHAQWGPRATSADQAVRLIAEVLAFTGDVEPGIAVWLAEDDRWGFTEANLRGEREPLASMVEELADGDPPTVRVEVTTADMRGVDALTTLDLVIGSTDAFEANHITWNLMESGKAVLSSPSNAQAALRALVTMTDCEWAAISSVGIDAAQPARREGPMIGWCTYVAHRRLPVGGIAIPGVAAEPVHRGYLYTVAPHPEETTAEAVLALAQRLRGERA